MIRALLALALIVAACFLASKWMEHHAAEDVFEQLHMHVVPAKLDPAHSGDALAIPVPGFLSSFTLDADMHPTGELPVFNLQIFQVTAVLLILVLFSGVAACIRSGRGDWLSRLFAGFASWIREEMVFPVMGRETGTRFLPFFLTVFFFVVFQNLLGLVPGSATATANIGVTAAMASVTLGVMLVGGMVVQGPLAFWKNLVPHGVPLPFVPLLFVVEIVGLVVKPVALTIRLFANMLGGHLIVLSVMGLIGFAGAVSATIGWIAAPLAVGFAVFIMIIESFVALLQAYIFTYLSILFVQMCIHPEH